MFCFCSFTFGLGEGGFVDSALADMRLDRAML